MTGGKKSVSALYHFSEEAQMGKHQRVKLLRITRLKLKPEKTV